ncbi:MAG TPA: gamma-glutamylcyclotransferase [Planctomycetaceae bacterium]|nr:gamma-glutamylcyclotransferase [Planctomycetaceae bacterium]
MSDQRLFIYGTLKRNHPRSRMLDGQRYEGDGQTLSRYRMHDCGSYPGLVDVGASNGQPIEGEVWTVCSDCLQQLDEEEGVSVGLYERRAIEVFGWVDVQAYFYLRSVAELSDCGPCWIRSTAAETESK